MAVQHRDEKKPILAPAARSASAQIFGYALSVLLVSVSTGLTLLLQDYAFRTPLFLPAILLSTWFGGTGPGVLAVILSTLSINFFILEPKFAFSFTFRDFVHLVVFLFSALVISSWSAARKRAENRLLRSESELRKARGELEAKVEERTAKLSRANEELQREIVDRKHAEEQLSREQQRFMDMVNSVDGIVWEADAETFVFSFVSKQAERILGYPVEQWLQPTFWSDHLHPEDRDWAAQLCIKDTSERRHHDFEYRMIAADGRIVWFRDLVAFVVEDNRPRRLRGVMVDTTERKRAEEAVRRSEKQLRDLVETMPAMAFVSRADGTNEFASRGWIEFSGLSTEQSAGSGWEVALHRDDREKHLIRWRRAHANGLPFENEARHRDANGNYRWLLVRAVPLRDEQGNILKWYGAVTDIEDRKRAEALLAGEKRILEMVAKGESLADILDALCRIVEGQTSGVLASILLLEGDRLRHGGAPSLPKAYTEAIDGVGIGPNAGSCGTAAFTGKQVIVEDIAIDPLWKDYRAAAFPHSLRACWSTPIFSSQGKVIATFAMYSHEPRRPSLSDQEIIEQITHLAGIAIERKLTEDKLALSESNLAEAQHLTHTGSFVWDLKTKQALYLSDEWYRIFGLEAGDKHAWDERARRIHPEDRDCWRTALDRAIDAKSEYDIEYRLILPGGITKYVHAVGHPVSNSCGETAYFMGSVTDVTERKQAEALLAGEKRLLEMIATGIPLKEILNTLCLIIEEQRNGTLASALLQNPDGVHLNVVAAPNLPSDWVKQMEEMPIGPCAGSCGTAAFRGEPVIVSDIATDPLWDVPEHRAAALQHGLKASWSNPVISPNGKVLGTFCIYHREPRSPTEQDFELIELATHIARVAIERDRAEEALRTSEQLARSHVEVMMHSLDVLATEAAPEKFVAEMLRTIGQRLCASSVLLWLRSQQDGSLRLRLVIENDQQVASQPDHPFVQDPKAWKSSPYFQEMFFTKGPVVCEDIEHDPRIGADFREYLIKRGRKRFMAIPMFVLGEVRGFIGIQHVEGGTYRPEEIELAQALAHHVMMAAHGAELAEQRHHAVVLEERTRMARDIHDTLAQGFTGVIVQMEAAEDALASGSRTEVNKHLYRAGDLARRSLSEARRSVHALRPQALEDHNFWDALKGTIRNTTAGTALHTTFQAQGRLPKLPPHWQENLLRIGQEALSNTLKYSHAHKFETRLSYKAKELRLELRDDGKGFKVKDRHDGAGLTGMRERVEQMGGELKINSSLGKGTKITVMLPCNGELMS